MRGVAGLVYLCVLLTATPVINGDDGGKESVDKVIEDEITHKLSEDLLQSIEKKFQVDLERAVDSVLMKIKLLLQNGTSHIQDRLQELQGLIEAMKKHSVNEVETCLISQQNETSALAEKALHQMVVCGYALIGHDPAQAVQNVMGLKNMIKTGLQPIYAQRGEVYKLLKVCGHDHDSLKKVIKCVISKSPQLKTIMMEVSGKLIDGVVRLTKLMAHGAMHEACLIEVIKTIEDEAFEVVKKVKVCAYGSNGYIDEVNNFIKNDNATVLDIENKDDKKEVTRDENMIENVVKDKINEKAAEVNEEKPSDKTEDPKEDKKTLKEMKGILRRMLKDKSQDKSAVKEQFLKLQKDLGTADANTISNLASIKD